MTLATRLRPLAKRCRIARYRDTKIRYPSSSESSQLSASSPSWYHPSAKPRDHLAVALGVLALPALADLEELPEAAPIDAVLGGGHAQVATLGKRRQLRFLLPWHGHRGRSSYTHTHHPVHKTQDSRLLTCRSRRCRRRRRQSARRRRRDKTLRLLRDQNGLVLLLVS